jgi:hypothetical protein
VVIAFSFTLGELGELSDLKVFFGWTIRVPLISSSAGLLEALAVIVQAQWI